MTRRLKATLSQLNEHARAKRGYMPHRACVECDRMLYGDEFEEDHGARCPHCGADPDDIVWLSDLLSFGQGKLGEPCPYCRLFKRTIPGCGTCKGTGTVCVAPDERRMAFGIDWGTSPGTSVLVDLRAGVDMVSKQCNNPPPAKCPASLKRYCEREGLPLPREPLFTMIDDVADARPPDPKLITWYDERLVRK